VSEPLNRILKAQSPLTLAGVPAGFLPWLAADLARAAHGTGASARAVIIAADEAAMRALQDTVPVFAPEVEVLSFPAWDCLPYDRASPALRVMAERLATLEKLQGKRKGPQLLLTTANAATQRNLTPFRIYTSPDFICGTRIQLTVISSSITRRRYTTSCCRSSNCKARTFLCCGPVGP